MSSDPWRHRSAGMTCRTCMWFAEKVRSNNLTNVGQDEPPVFGRCRRRAPTMAGYPTVFGIDWCGDHKIDENRL